MCIHAQNCCVGGWAVGDCAGDETHGRCPLGANCAAMQEGEGGGPAGPAARRAADAAQLGPGRRGPARKNKSR
eukprot:3408367-Pyramimonas_sp.AAC.1